MLIIIIKRNILQSVCATEHWLPDEKLELSRAIYQLIIAATETKNLASIETTSLYTVVMLFYYVVWTEPTYIIITQMKKA